MVRLTFKREEVRMEISVKVGHQHFLINTMMRDGWTLVYSLLLMEE